MPSTSGSTFYDYGTPPPIAQRNPNRPRKNGPGSTPYYQNSADLPRAAEGDSEDGISNTFAGMGLQDQRNPTPQAFSGLLSPLGSGRLASRPATPMPNQFPYYQPQRNTSTRSRAVSQASPPISPLNSRYPGSSSRQPASQNMRSAVHTPASVASQAPSSAFSQTSSAYASSGHRGPIWALAPKPKTPKRRNTYSGPGLTKGQVAYLNSQHGSTSGSSRRQSVSSGTSRHRGSISGCSRSSSVYSGTSQTSSGPCVMVQYGYPAVLYPIVEHPFQFTPQPPVVHSRTVQVSQTTCRGTTTYTEHQQVVIPPRFY